MSSVLVSYIRYILINNKTKFDQHVLYLFIDKMKGGNGIISEQPFFHGAWHAFQSAFFYGLIPALVINALFDIRNWKYILINVGYWLVAVSIMGGIIGIMG